MALTKQQFVDLLIINLNASGNNPEVDYEEIAAVTDIAISTLIGTYVKFNRELPDAFVSAFEKVEIKYNVARAEYFSYLPANRIILSGDRDIIQISPMRGQKKAWVKMKSTSKKVFSNLEAGSLVGTTFYPEGQKIFYENLPTLANGKPMVNEVLIKMIASTFSLSDDAVIPLPGELEGKLLEMVQAGLREQKMTKADDVDDNSKNNK